MITEKRIATYREIIETQALIAESHVRISALISSSMENLIGAYESQKPKSTPGRLFVMPRRKTA